MKNKREKILITGISGFLGRYLESTCISLGYDVIGVDKEKNENSLNGSKYIYGSLEELQWEKILEEERPSLVFHLAATSSVAASIKDPFGDFSNVLPSIARLLYGIAKYSPKSIFVNYSSAAVYGNPKEIPIRESDAVEPISPYGVNKHVAEQLIYAMSKCYGVTSVSLRIFSAYGKWLKKQIFFDIHHKLIEAKNNGNKFLYLSGTGNETRDFIHGQDVAYAALLAAKCAKVGEFNIVNVGNGEEICIADVANLYKNIFGSDVEIVFDNITREGDPINWCADIRKLKDMGYSSTVDVRSGLEEYFKWLVV